MSAPKKSSLTSLAQLDEFNKEVWALTEGEFAQYVKQSSKSTDTVSPSEFSAIADEATSGSEDSAPPTV